MKSKQIPRNVGKIGVPELNLQSEKSVWCGKFRALPFRIQNATSFSQQIRKTSQTVFIQNISLLFIFTEASIWLTSVWYDKFQALPFCLQNATSFSQGIISCVGNELQCYCSCMNTISPFSISFLLHGHGFSFMSFSACSFHNIWDIFPLYSIFS